MIRRQVDHEWWLFAQHDHAALAGDFAAQLGGQVRPLEREVLAATRNHDVGWIEPDAATSINSQGQPVDVFETPIESALTTWRQSSLLGHQALGDYGGLLVSCHSLALSAHAAKGAFASKPGRAADLPLHFRVNKFQHAEIELQEQIRRRLGMRLDAPLTCGLALESIEPREQQLVYDYRWLAGMDQLSLDVLCSSVVFPVLAQVTTAPGLSPQQYHVTRLDLHRACVRPWPFVGEAVTARIPFRRLPATPFQSDEALRGALRNAAVEQLAVELIPTSPLAASA